MQSLLLRLFHYAVRQPFDLALEKNSEENSESILLLCDINPDRLYCARRKPKGIIVIPNGHSKAG